MPIAIERDLEARARRKGLTGKHRLAYIYGALNKIEKNAKGKLADAYHKIKNRRG